MKTLFTILIFSVIYATLSARTITDMAGRTVVIPETITKVFPYDAKTSILIFPLLANKMVATAIYPGQNIQGYISKDYTSLPQVDVKNIEEVLSVAPQVIIAGFYDNKVNNEPVEDLGKRLSIPVIFIDLSIDKADLSYTFLGTLFKCEKEARIYALYFKELYAKVAALKKQKNITQTVYYTLGETGLLTDPSGSKHTEVFDLLNIPNAAKVPIPSGGHAQVNMEQVLMWNPDYIFTSTFRGKSNAYNTIISDSKWEDISAVKNKKVYAVPCDPFSWLDHPPSINRTPGIVWLCELFYGLPPKDSQRLITTFFKLFYHYDLSEAEYKKLFK
jgi:iron complex transport system substrate-binding protein